MILFCIILTHALALYGCFRLGMDIMDSFGAFRRDK